MSTWQIFIRVRVLIEMKNGKEEGKYQVNIELERMRRNNCERTSHAVHDEVGLHSRTTHP